MTREDWIDAAFTLALRGLQEQLDQSLLSLDVGILLAEDSLNIEFYPRKVLNWKAWFSTQQYRYPNRFQLAIRSRGKPPIVIGAAVYSCDINERSVSIHMAEHFKNVLPISALNKRMAFCVFYAAINFAKISGMKWLRLTNPLPLVIDYYCYWGFKVEDDDAMIINVKTLKEKLIEHACNNAQHNYEWQDPDDVI